MSSMMNRVVVILVLVGLVYCDEQKGTVANKKPSVSPTSPPVGNNSTSSVIVASKVQNVTVDYKNHHSPPSNASYATKPPTINSTTTEKPLIISTSKETRLIQTPTKLNDSIAIASSRSSTITQQHPNLITSRIRPNEHKKDAPRISHPSIKPTPQPTTSSPYSPKNKTASSGHSYSYFNMATTKDASTQIDVERKEVKEMRVMENSKENKKFRFYLVSDPDSESGDKSSKTISHTTIVHYNNSRPQVRNIARSPQVKDMSFNTDEKNGHSKPYHGDWSQSKYNPRDHMHPTTVTPSVKESLSPIPTIYTVRPSRHNISITTAYPLLSHHKKVNVSSINLVNNEKTPLATSDFSCLRCVGYKGPKQLKYPTYPTKNDPTAPGRAVSLLGPDGDSILGSSKRHYAVTRPETQASMMNNTERYRIQTGGVKTHLLGQRDSARKPFIGHSSVPYSSSSSVENPVRNPEIGYSSESRYKDRINNKQPDMSDLYNLDELESSGSSHSHSHVKYERKEIHIPYPVTIEKKVPYPIHIQVDRPVAIHIDKPYPVHVEKKVPVPVKVHVPQPYPIEKEVPYPVKIPIDVPRPVEVAKPIPYMVENPVPIQIIKHIKVPIKVPVVVPVPFKVPVHVEKRVPYFVEKKVPFDVPVPVEKPYFVEVKTPFEVPLEIPQAVTVEKKIPVPVQVIEFIKVPIPVSLPHQEHGHQHHHNYQQRLGVQQTSRGNSTGFIGERPAPKTEEVEMSTTKPERNETKIQHRMGTLSDFDMEQDDLFTMEGASRPIKLPFRLPRMISVEFHQPHFTQNEGASKSLGNGESPTGNEQIAGIDN